MLIFDFLDSTDTGTDDNTHAAFIFLLEVQTAVFDSNHGRGKSHLGKPIHERLPYNRAEVVWAVREEMARTVEDVLARRTRSLLLNARASIECAPEVARLMAAEMGCDDEWIRSQVEEYSRLANGYILN